MPNRIIKESICTSEEINALSWFDEVVWYRLLVNCDDYGRMDARPAILRSRLFPLKSNVTDKAMAESLNHLATVGLVTTYICDGKPHLQIVKWDKHQQIRAKRSKYPAPSEADITCNHMISNDSICPRNPIQSKKESESESEYEYENNRASARALFARFWEAYPRKVAKAEAEKAWKKLKPDEDLLCVMLNAIDAAKQSQGWQEAGGRFIPHPATWLNQRRWEDELSPSTGRLDNLQRLYEMFEEEEREQTRNN